MRGTHVLRCQPSVSVQLYGLDTTVGQVAARAVLGGTSTRRQVAAVIDEERIASLHSLAADFRAWVVMSERYCRERK